MKRTTLGLLAALLATAVSAHSAAAQGQITNLIVATDKDATTGLEIVPAGTKSVWAIFDYEGASDSDFGVVLMSPDGGWQIFTDEDSYSGNGTAEVEITGAAMYANIMAELADMAEATESSLVKVATQQQVRDYSNQVISNINQMRPLVTMIDTADYGGLDQQQLSTLTSSMDSLIDLKKEMADTQDDQRKKDVAAQMEPHVAALMSAVEALQDASVPDFPVPASASPSSTYVLKVEVNGSPSKSTEFSVYGSTAQAPGTSTGGTPTGSVGGPSGAAGASGKPTVAPGPPTEAVGGESEAEGGADASGGGTGLSAAGSGTIGRSGGPTATPSTEGAESAPPGGVDAPVGAEEQAKLAAVQAGQMDSSSAAPTAITAKGVVGRIQSASGGAVGGLDGGSGSGPNFAMLLVGVVVLAGVAVFMKGRM